MRVLALAAIAILVAGCSGKADRGPRRESSLDLLRHLTADESHFGVILDARTGRAVAAFRTNNPIRAAVSDGHGGWYIGGGFIHVNGELRKRLAHVDANGRLDPNWKPEANGNGVSVTSLARIGSRLYVAGDFAKLEHEPRFQLGALDLPSGRLDSWKPQRSTWYSYDGLVGAGRRLITGGNSCCSEAGSAVNALDVHSGRLDPTWRPHVGSARLYGNGVYMLANGGRAVLIRGLFGRPLDRVAAGELDLTNGRLVGRWHLRSSKPCLWCTLMAAAIGRDRIYASVNGGTWRYRVVAFSRHNGKLDQRWRVRLSAVTGFYGANSVSAIAATDHRVYVIGEFDRINGVRRNGFAALDPGTARVLPSWNPRASLVSGWILVQSRKRVLLGVTLARKLEFNYAGLKTYRPVRRLELMLALSGPGSVHIGLGRGCNVDRWASSSSLRCSGRLLRWLTTIRFSEAARKRYVSRLGVPPGRYFVHFVPQSPKGVPQPAVQDFPIIVR